MKVALCICTCQRPEGLRRLLDALAAIDWSEHLHVVVVDNDKAQEGRAVCRNVLDAGYRWPISHVWEPRRGISFARNRAVAEALSLDEPPDCIAMLDDDEWPSRAWLAEIVRVMREKQADLVGGPVMPIFPERRAAWVDAALDCFGADEGLADGARCTLHASGNFIGRRSCFEALSPECFRADFAHSGGEDFEFFRRLELGGYRMHWAAGAVVHEAVPPSRVSIDWVRHRMLLKGNIQVRMFRLYAPGALAESWRWAKTLALFATGAGKYLLGLAHEPTRMRGRLMLWRALGKARAHFGHTMSRPGQIDG